MCVFVSHYRAVPTSPRDRPHPAEQALGEALAAVELAGTESALEQARVWVLVLGERYVNGEEELFGDPKEREKEHRDQFVALIREELGVDN